MHQRRLPIASPCSERFAAMAVVDGSQRYCDRCEQGVYDLSSMTEAEAEYFMLQRRRRGQPTCIRFEVRPDREIRFRPAPPRTTGPALVALAGLVAACTGHLETAELDSPEDGLTCEDAAGYTIPCIDGSEPEPEPEPEPEVIEDLEPLEELDPTDERPDPPQWANAPAEEERTEDGEGCPLKRWDDPPNPAYEIAGGMPDHRYTPSERRRIERNYHDEQRRSRARRKERRERRRPRRDEPSSI